MKYAFNTELYRGPFLHLRLWYEVMVVHGPSDGTTRDPGGGRRVWTRLRHLRSSGPVPVGVGTHGRVHHPSGSGTPETLVLVSRRYKPLSLT